ncbi:PepSY domain-containing protein [Rhodobacter sp. Har01]|uniref:PepSY domain-containing protein n=1 Tax=Rhodobacter sp. Har01 TaxID=2883999 RepID=UPI001D093CA9|nr:PepSY domain-containing protein [Rhodobacter sp. Har01]MCB6178758.1 PepSY domain-containing protein [Rhodobacter sp. Har01]
MTRILLLTVFLAGAPLTALAAPAVGDNVGTTKEDATAALKEIGCLVQSFEAEAGKIEAKCIDEAGKKSEVYIDPKTGLITEIKAGEED